MRGDHSHLGVIQASCGPSLCGLDAAQRGAGVGAGDALAIVRDHKGHLATCAFDKYFNSWLATLWPRRVDRVRDNRREGLHDELARDKYLHATGAVNLDFSTRAICTHAGLLKDLAHEVGNFHLSKVGRLAREQWSNQAFSKLDMSTDPRGNAFDFRLELMR